MRSGKIDLTGGFECQGCPNNCEIRRVVFEKEMPLFYGSRCGKFDGTDKIKSREDNPLPNLFNERSERLTACLDELSMGKRVGIPQTGVFFDLAPLWIAFFQKIGCEVVLSDATNRSIIKRGVENVLAEPCFLSAHHQDIDHRNFCRHASLYPDPQYHMNLGRQPVVGPHQCNTMIRQSGTESVQPQEYSSAGQFFSPSQESHSAYWKICLIPLPCH